MRSGMSTEMTYEELMCALCPLWDADESVRRLKKNSKGIKEAENFLGNLEGQIQRATTILTHSVADIEAENPDVFGDGSECEPVWLPT